MREISGVDIFKALADESRVRAWLALRHGELCVCQIVALLQLAPSTVSKHLQILKDAGLIQSHKNGRWVYYRLSKGDIGGFSAKTIKQIQHTLAQSSIIRKDEQQLEKICKTDTEVLCQIQKNG